MKTDASPSSRKLSGFLLAFSLLLWSIVSAQAVGFYKVGTTNLWESQAAGTDSVALAVGPATLAWSASTSNSWLHLDATSQNGVGSTNVVFHFDANSGGARTGNLTIGNQTVTVTQAGSSYVKSTLFRVLVNGGILGLSAVALDTNDNVYFTDIGHNAIDLWSPTNGSVSTLISSGISNPYSVAVDAANNVYICDYGDNSIKEWVAASSNLVTLVSTGLNGPRSVALDRAGNVYIADSNHQLVKEWISASNTVVTLTIPNLSGPVAVAVDVAGNVYVANYYGDEILKYSPVDGSTTSIISSTLFPGAIARPNGVAVDGSGSVYFVNYASSPLQKWTPGSNTVSTVATGLYGPNGMAVDPIGNVFIGDPAAEYLYGIFQAYVDDSTVYVSDTATNATLSPILPPASNLQYFPPATDQSWLTISGITNGALSLSFPASPGSVNAASIGLFGVSIPFVQGVLPPPILINAQAADSNVVQFSFTNYPEAPFMALCSTNATLPLSQWTPAGTPVEISPGQFQFTSDPITNSAQLFFSVRSR